MRLLKATVSLSQAESSEKANSSEFSSDDYLREKPRDRKKTWGIFYTPIEVSRCLADWAIRSSEDTALEPSFGGCGFLKEAARALADKGCDNPWAQLCGCDKDLAAFGNLPREYAHPGRQRRFLHSNFLDTTPADYHHEQFSVVIGNPPYVSRHNMRQYQLDSAARVNEANEGAVPGRASLWAYFLVHSLRFLKPTGRMAWVLPRSLSQSDYGRRMVEYLCERFDSVAVISVGHRLFLNYGAEEVIDVLLCAGYRPQKGIRTNPLVTYANSVQDLVENIKSAVTSHCALAVDISSGRQELLTQAERNAIADYGHVVSVRRFGDIAKIKIGIVTGATRFFVLRYSDLKEAGLTKHACTPLLTKATYARGLAWQVEDVVKSTAANLRVLLVRDDLDSTQRYWAKFPSDLRKSIATFKKRSKWNAPDDKKIPPAFFFGLVDNGPRLVVNDASSNSNNSIYRVYFDPKLTKWRQRAISLFMMSSYVQVSGEMVGRVCGSGGLKFEPSDAYKLKIIESVAGLSQAHIEELWTKVDNLVRSGNEAEAIQCVDMAIQQCSQGALSTATVATVQAALYKLRAARKGAKRSRQ